MSDISKLRYKDFGVSKSDTSENQGLQSLSQDINDQQAGISKVNRDLQLKWEEVEEKSKGALGTMMMRSGDKKLLKRLDDSREEASKIILSSQNKSLGIVAETMVRHTKNMANTLTILLETNSESAVEQHFMDQKLKLTEKLESLNDRLVHLLEEKEQKIASSSDLIKPMLKDQALILLSNWMDDYEKIVQGFSQIREKKFL